VSGHEVLDFYAVRVALDGLAARLAARQALPAEVTQLRWLNDRMAKAADLPSQHDFSVQFHVALYQASHNRLLQHFGNEMLDWQRGFSASTFADKARLLKAHRDHTEIVEAIEKHDERRAEQGASRHMMNALEARADKMGLAPAAGKATAAKVNKGRSKRAPD
jgi:DNA-binding FadR family transcriptional regulator